MKILPLFLLVLLFLYVEAGRRKNRLFKTRKEHLDDEKKLKRIDAKELRQRFNGRGGRGKGLYDNVEKLQELKKKWEGRRNRRHSRLPKEVKETSDAIAEITQNSHESPILSIATVNAEFAHLFIEGDIAPSDLDLQELEAKLTAEESIDGSGEVEGTGETGTEVLTRNKRGAPITSHPSWLKDKPIPYVLGDEYSTSEKNVIRSGIQSIIDNTCVNFKENGEGDKLAYYKGAGCSSMVGDLRKALGGNQKVSLADGCLNLGTIQHETMHALGFTHTQNRVDREDYVTVDYSTIMKGRENNFAKLTPQQMTTDYGVPYEYGSRMHYPAYDFSNSSKPVLVPKNKDNAATMGSSLVLTFYDWKLINSRYNCSDSCSKKITCKNGGFQHPRQCTKCICSDYYTGTLCDSEQNVVNLKTGATASSFSFKQFANFTTLNDPKTDFNDVSKYKADPLRVIKAPTGKKIRFTIKNMLPHFDAYTCDVFGVEIRDGDLALVGKKFCTSNQNGYSFVSNSNVVGYRVYAGPGFYFDSTVTFQVQS